MTRRNAALSLIGVCAAAALATACVDPQGDAGPEAASPDTGWVIPPRIDAVEQGPGGLSFKGVGQPGGRVVLRSLDGAAFAAVADASGRFDIRMAAPTGPLLLIPETQEGQDASPSPQRLIILGGGEGAVALLTPGGPARRLDRVVGLGAVDADGRALLVSGRAAPDAEVKVGPAPLRAAADGSWLMAVDGSGPRTLMVDGVSYAYPGEAGSGALVERAGAGWRVRWSTPDGAAQTTWLPAG